MTLQLLIGGKNHTASGGRTYERHDPVTGKVACVAAAATPADALAAVDAAAKAFAVWSTKGPEARRSVLMKAGEIMERRAGDFISAMVEETGATKTWAGFNVHLATGILREAGAMTTQIASPARWRCRSPAPAASASVSRRGTRRSFSAREQSLCRSPAGTRWCSRHRKCALSPIG